MKKHYLFYLSLTLIAAITSCKKEQDLADEPTTQNNGDGSTVTGWTGNDDPNSVPSAVNIGSNQSVPGSYDLVSKFPPVGNQGNYGTCVAWASGYNMKTALEGMDRGLNTNQLASSSNQISPRDLFTAIPDAAKGQNCNGTNFTDALNLLLGRGAATLQTVPYTNLNGCANANLQSNWTQEAGNHKIKSYRKLNLKVSEIKENIANNIPVLCGAKLSDAFVNWNNDNVLTSNTTYDQVGMHSYHALMIGGYDDSKGPNGAFRIINSWGNQWGDAGYIWVDYNFFVNEFCFDGNVYIAINENGNVTPPNHDTTASGQADLAAWAFSDVSTTNQTGYINSRQINYNIYNIGDQPAQASKDWTVCYIYYNAYDANDYGFLFYDDINTSIAQGTYTCPTSDHCIINTDIPAGGNFANEVFNQTSLTQDYFVPNITGQYYLVMIADAYDKFGEQDEQNNLFYTTDQTPVYFINGQLQKNSNGKPAVDLKNYSFKNPLAPSTSNMKNNPYRTSVNKNNPNAYSYNEIKKMISHQRNTATWNRKIEDFKNRIKIKR